MSNISSWQEEVGKIKGSFNTVDSLYIVESDRDQDFYHDGEGILFSSDLRVRAYELAYRLSLAGFPSRVRKVYFYRKLAKNPTFEDRTINPGM